MSDLLEYKGYTGSIEYSAADDILHGKIQGIRSLVSYEGKSLSELRSDFEGAVDDYLIICEAEGLEPEKPYRGSFNVRISPELHRDLAVYAISHDQSLNSTVEEAIRKYVR